MKQKGFVYLLNMVDKLSKTNPDLEFKIIVLGWGGFIRDEQREITKRGLERFFEFLLQTDKMGEAIKGVDAVVIPSLWETYPLLPIEARPQYNLRAVI